MADGDRLGLVEGKDCGCDVIWVVGALLGLVVGEG